MTRHEQRGVGRQVEWSEGGISCGQFIYVMPLNDEGATLSRAEGVKAATWSDLRVLRSRVPSVESRLSSTWLEGDRSEGPRM